MRESLLNGYLNTDKNINLKEWIKFDNTRFKNIKIASCYLKVNHFLFGSHSQSDTDKIKKIDNVIKNLNDITYIKKFFKHCKAKFNPLSGIATLAIMRNATSPLTLFDELFMILKLNHKPRNDTNGYKLIEIDLKNFRPKVKYYKQSVQFVYDILNLENKHYFINLNCISECCQFYADKFNFAKLINLYDMFREPSDNAYTFFINFLFYILKWEKDTPQHISIMEEYEKLRTINSKFDPGRNYVLQLNLAIFKEHLNQCTHNSDDTEKYFDCLKKGVRFNVLNKNRKWMKKLLNNSEGIDLSADKYLDFIIYEEGVSYYVGLWLAFLNDYFNFTYKYTTVIKNKHFEKNFLDFIDSLRIFGKNKKIVHNLIFSKEILDYGIKYKTKREMTKYA